MTIMKISWHISWGFQKVKRIWQIQDVPKDKSEEEVEKEEQTFFPVGIKKQSKPNRPDDKKETEVDAQVKILTYNWVSWFLLINFPKVTLYWTY